MRNTLFATLCATLLILSLGLRPPVSEAEKTFKEISNKFEIALLSNNATNTKAVMIEAIELLGKASLNFFGCAFSTSQLVDAINSFQQYPDSITFMNALYAKSWFDHANRACFPLVNLVRSLIVGGAQVLGMNTTNIPDFKTNKIISVDLPNNAFGKTLLVAEDAMRFVECYSTAGTLFLWVMYIGSSSGSFLNADLLKFAVIGGTQAVGVCGDAITLAQEIFTQSQKEAKVVAEVEKISTALFAEDKTEVELLAFNDTVSTVLDTLVSLGYADLCLNELTTTLYQYFMAEYITPNSMVPYTFLTQMILSTPFSANEDCLPYTNFVKYSFVEAANLIFKSNITYTPREGGIIKLEDLGFSDSSYIRKGLSGISTGLDTLRCVTASVATLPFVADTFSNVRHGQWSGALSTFESAIFQALGGKASCTEIYNQFKQRYGTF